MTTRYTRQWIRRTWQCGCTETGLEPHPVGEYGAGSVAGLNATEGTCSAHDRIHQATGYRTDQTITRAEAVGSRRTAGV